MPAKTCEMVRTFKITVIRSGKSLNVKGKFAFDVTKKLYNDILPGEYYSPLTTKFYSQSHGYILTSEL